MALNDDIAYVRAKLSAYEAADTFQMSGASVGGSAGVPPEMFDGEIESDGWVKWKMLPSTLSEGDVCDLESELRVKFPPLFRAYLLAAFHLFDQVRSRKYDQLIFNSDVPLHTPFDPIRDLINAWRPLPDTGFVPFAEWGDGWGPMCFDTQQRRDDGDYPIVWMDHELIIPLGHENLAKRGAVLHFVNPLYESYREFFEDVFSVSEES